MKETVYKLLTNLNKLNQTEDAVVKIDWKNLSAIVVQSTGVFWMNEFLILMNPGKGIKYIALTTELMENIRVSLISYLNNRDRMEIIPEKNSFRLISLVDVLSNNQEVKIWSRFSRTKLTLNRFDYWLLTTFSTKFRYLKSRLPIEN